MAMTTTMKLKDRYSGGSIWITLCDGLVVGAMGCEPQRFVGLTARKALHLARYGAVAR